MLDTAVIMTEEAKSPQTQRWIGELKVAEIIIETPTVKTFRLVNPAGGNLPFTFLPGQFLQLNWDCDGKNVRRSFTIASSPLKSHYADVTVKREDHGLVSTPMCDQA